VGQVTHGHRRGPHYDGGGFAVFVVTGKRIERLDEFRV